MIVVELDWIKGISIPKLVELYMWLVAAVPISKFGEVEQKSIGCDNGTVQFTISQENSTFIIRRKRERITIMFGISLNCYIFVRRLI